MVLPMQRMNGNRYKMFNRNGIVSLELDIQMEMKAVNTSHRTNWSNRFVYMHLFIGSAFHLQSRGRDNGNDGSEKCVPAEFLFVGVKCKHIALHTLYKVIK